MADATLRVQATFFKELSLNIRSLKIVLRLIGLFTKQARLCGKTTDIRRLTILLDQIMLFVDRGLEIQRQLEENTSTLVVELKI